MNYGVDINVNVRELFDGLSEIAQFELVRELLSELPDREIGEIITRHLELADTDRMISVLEEQGYKVTEEE